MIRLLIIATVALPPTSSWARDDGAEAMCHGADVARVPLEGYEFEVSGYDPGRGVVTLRLAPFVIRDGRVLGLSSVGPLLLAMSASDLEVALDARAKDTLRLELTLRCVERPVMGPYADTCCDKAVPVVAKLTAGQMLLAERDVTRPFPPRPRIDAYVRVGRLRLDDGGAPPDAAEVSARARMHGHSCLKRALHGTLSVQGSLTVVLQLPEDRQPRPPRVSIDVLVNQALSHCLVQALFEDAALWKMMPSSAKLHVPFYFRGGVEPSDVNGEKPPAP